MTLRARLTGAFLVVVVGPVLIGAFFVGGTVTAVNQSRERDRLDVAVTSLRTAIGGTCDRLQSAAEAAASATAGGTRPLLAAQIVAQGRASAIHIESAAGDPLVTTDAAPPPPWAMCTSRPGTPSFIDDGYRAIAAVVEMRDTRGHLIGYCYAVQRLDAAYLRQLSDAAGVGVTVLDSAGQSTEKAATARRIGTAAGRLGAQKIGTTDGVYVRRMDPVPDEPLTIALSVPVTTSGGLFVIALAVILFAALAAIGAAWALARGTTRPLDEITEAAGRISRGDLDARVPIRHDDEVGHLGAAFNRMSRERQSYVEALTASRDQLRGNLDVLGDTLSSTHDLPRILRVTLGSAIVATGARGGIVLLADPTDGRLRSHCAEGFDESASARLAKIAIPAGEGLLGGVAMTGIAVRGRTTAGRPVLAADEPFCHTYLVVPLRAVPVTSSVVPAQMAGDTAPGSGGVWGVLALYDRLGDDEFDERDLRTVRTFAGHAAVAVDNVYQHDEAQRLSHTDPLTGLYNYRHLKDLIRREVNRSTRFGHPMCVMVLDLDRFKEVNDVYGHAAGDAVLVEFARRIGVVIRGVDLAFRYGGEEFVLLLPETDGLGGITLAQRLGAAIRDTPIAVAVGHGPIGEGVSLDGLVDIAVSVSIGVAVFPAHGMSGSQVLEAADDALYAAKAAGRDTFRLAAPRTANPFRSAASAP